MKFEQCHLGSVNISCRDSNIHLILLLGKTVDSFIEDYMNLLLKILAGNS